jgi:acyl carrier protein
VFKEKIRSFILQELAWDKFNGDFNDDHLLLEEGIIDSVGMLKLISFIEETFAVKMLDDDLTPENFETLTRIAQMVERNLSNRLKQNEL